MRNISYLISHILISALVLIVLKSGLGSQHFTPIQIAPLQAHDEHFGAGQVGGDGDIVLEIGRAHV